MSHGARASAANREAALAPTLAWLAVLVIAYTLTSWIGLRTATMPAHTSVVWPSAALALAACLSWGRRAWPVVYLVAFALVLWVGARTLTTGITAATVGIAASLALGYTVQAAVTAYCLTRWIPAGLFALASTVFRFAGIVAVCSLIGSSGAAATFLFGGLTSIDNYLDAWPAWWLADLTGVAVFTPLLLQWREILRVSRRRGWVAEAIGTVITIVLLAVLAYFGWSRVSNPQYLMAFVALPCIVWIAFRFRPPGVGLTGAFVSAIALGAITHAATAPARELTPATLQLFQGFSGLVCVTGLALSAAITAAKRADKATRAEKARYVDLYENSPDMLASVNADTAFVTECNQTMAHLLGLTKDQIIGRSVFDLYDPDSREVARRAFDAFRTTGQGRFPELALVRSNGNKIEVSLTASAVRDSTGRIVSISTAWHDISARKLAERALTESQEIWRAFIEQAPAAIAMFDKKMRYLAVSRRFLSDSGFPPDRELYGASHYEVFTSMPEHWKAAHRRALAGEVVTVDEDCFQTEDGRVQWLHWECRPWYDVGGLAGVVLFTEDISHRKHATDALRKLNAELEQRVRDRTAELESLAREMEERSLTDQLTGLPNRRALDQRLSLDTRLSTRHQLPLSLLMIDVDHFKEYNDSFGHPAGDEVLRRVAQVLQQTLRTTDFAARWGGEEFAAVLMHTDAVGAVVVAERLRERLAQTQWPKRKITVSIGAATLTDHVADAAAFIAQADAALYDAKRLGRNRVASAPAHEYQRKNQKSA